MMYANFLNRPLFWGVPTDHNPYWQKESITLGIEGPICTYGTCGIFIERIALAKQGDNR